MSVGQLIRLCSRLLDPNGKIVRGWRFRSRKRPWTLSDFILPTRKWDVCSKTVGQVGMACRPCLEGIESALSIPNWLTPETRPYFQATADKTREWYNQHAANMRVRRLSHDEMMKSSPVVAARLYGMHISLFPSACDWEEQRADRVQDMVCPLMANAKLLTFVYGVMYIPRSTNSAALRNKTIVE